MKRYYRGYTLEVKREKCMAGYNLLYYNITRDSDGYMPVDSFEDSNEKVWDKVKQLIQRINSEHLEEDPWLEKEELNLL